MRILVATEGSEVTRTVEWAAEMAERYAAELLVLEVVAPEHLVGGASDGAAEPRWLEELAQRLAGPRGRARLVYDSDPSEAIVRVAEEERADIVVVGNISMSERTEFLLASVPNRVSHNARCTVVIVNTTDGGPRREPVTEEAAETTEGQLLGRAARIASVVAKYGLGDLVARSRDRDAAAAARARRFRHALEELGPTFAKLGQILSTRPDLLSAAFVEELSTLQDQVTPLTEAEVVAVMENELKVPWEDVFVSIESDPMAAGTIAQVHRAVLTGGERVVVKVQRPTAESEILKDLGLLERFSEKAADREAFRRVVDVPAIIEHLLVAAARARLPPRGGQHRADARGVGAVRPARRPARLRRPLHRAPARHGGGAGHPRPAGARGRRAFAGRPPAARVVLPAGPHRRLLPRGPASWEPDVVERQDLPAGPRDDRRGRSGVPRVSAAPAPRVLAGGHALPGRRHGRAVR